MRGRSLTAVVVATLLALAPQVAAAATEEARLLSRGREARPAMGRPGRTCFCS